MALPVDEANDVEELVDHVLGSDADANLLEGLCELLTSIQEFAGVVKVREAILVKKMLAFGGESKEAGAALFNLGRAYWTSVTTPRRATPTSARSRSTSASTVATARRWPAC